jgi:hypothetical protein
LIIANILFAVLIVWWFEELGIIHLGLYAALGISFPADKSEKKTLHFSKFGYPLELDRSANETDGDQWNGSGKYSTIASKLSFLKNLNSERTQSWIHAQQLCTSNYFSHFISLRNKISKKNPRCI